MDHLNPENIENSLKFWSLSVPLCFVTKLGIKCLFKSSGLECLGYRDIAVAQLSDRKVPYPKLSVTKHDAASITQFQFLKLFGKVRDPSSLITINMEIPKQNKCRSQIQNTIPI